MLTAPQYERIIATLRADIKRWRRCNALWRELAMRLRWKQS